MITTSIVGRYLDRSTMTLHTVVMLMPEDYFPGSERFITDKGECVWPTPDVSGNFQARGGRLLQAT